MKKILSWVLVLAMLLSAVPAFAYADIVKWDKEISFTDDAIKGAVLEIWGNYAFITHQNGIIILDLKTEDKVATWTFDKTNTGVNNFKPNFITITDEYIFVSGKAGSSANILVYENTGVFTDATPTFVRRIGKFNNIKSVEVVDDCLYIFDHLGSGTIKGEMTDTLVAWKLAVSDITELKVTNMYSALDSNDAAEYVSFGIYDNVWNDVVYADGAAYSVGFNSTDSEPFMTIVLNAVELDDFTNETGVSITPVFDGEIKGFKVEFEIEGTPTVSNLRDKVMIHVEGDDENSIALRKIKRDTAVFKIEAKDENSSFVEIYLMEASEIASQLKKAFPSCAITAEELSAGTKTLAATVNGEVYTFSDEQAGTEIYQDGNAVFDGSTLHLTTRQKLTNRENYHIAVDVDGAAVASISEPNLIGTSDATSASSFITTVMIDDMICGFFDNDFSFKGILPEKDKENLFMANVAVKKDKYMSNDSDFSSIVANAGKLYYILNTSKALGVLDVNGVIEKDYVFKSRTAFPVIFYGSSESDEITATVGESEVAVPVENNYYRLPIYSVAADTEVTLGRNTEAVTAVSPIVEASYAEGTLSLTNNTADYGVAADKLLAATTLYNADGSIAGYSENANVTDSLAVALPDGGKASVGIFNSARTPIAGFEVTAEGATKTSTDNAVGAAKDIVLNDVRFEGNKAVISGKLSGIGERAVGATVKKGNTVVWSGITNANTDGIFSIAYDFSGADIEDVFTVEVTTSFDAKTEVTEFSLSDSEALKTAVTYIKENVEDGEALKAYLSANDDIAAILGVDLSDTEYTALSEEAQKEIMETVLAEIKADKTADAADKFEAGVKEKTLQKAIKEVNAADEETLMAVLMKYKTLFGISEDLWEKYNRMGTKIPKVNKEFLKTTVTEETDISDILDDAIDEVKDAENEDKKKPSSGGGGGGGGISLPPVTITPQEPGEKPTVETMFDDLGSVEWARTAIEMLAKKGIVSGMGERIFAPNDGVTREQFIKMIVEVIGYDKLAEETTFTDCVKGEWYYGYVAEAEKKGLAAGTDGRFGVGDKLSRQDAAVFLYRAAGQIGKVLNTEGELDFVDAAEIAPYATEAITAMKNAKVINGMDQNTFQPNGGCTRAMAAQMIYSFINIK